MKYVFALYTLVALLCMQAGKAQINESFADGDFSNAPTWTPNLASDWTIDAGQLRSNASTASYNFYVSTPQTLATTVQWEMKINLQFNTSSTNYVDIYLASQQANLQSATNSGYFVRIGGTADEVSLYKITAGTNAILINGTDGKTNTSNNTLKIKVIRDVANLWTLQSDLTGTGNTYQTEGTVTDNSFSTSAFFGFRVQQSTATFFNKHFFDDIVVSTYAPDVTLPTLQSVNVLTSNELSVKFSEDVNTTATQTTNYTVNNGIGAPASIATIDAQTVRLTFAQNFQSAIVNQLTVQNIEDLAGNKILTTNQNFTYTEVLLTDDFVDNDYTQNPAWTPNLPTDWTIENGRLRSNASTENYNFYISAPNTRATVAEWEMDINLALPTSSTNFVDVYLASAQANLQSTTNSGYFVRIGRTQDDLTLYKFVGTTNTLLIDGTDAKTNAPDNKIKLKVSRDANNVWKLFADYTGTGTDYELEGTTTDNTYLSTAFFGLRVQQSTASFFNKHFFDNVTVRGYVPDTTLPTLISTEPLSATELLLTFSETLGNASAQNTANYSVNNGIGLPASAQLQGSKKVLLTFAQSFVSATNYALTAQNVADLEGNKLLTVQQPFTFVQTFAPAYNDLIITEIMADPLGSAQPLNPLPNVEYIELHNRSNKILNLKNCTIEDEGTTKTIATTNLILNPNEYILLCEAGQASNLQVFGRTVGIPSFLSLTNGGERLTLKNGQASLVFSVRYTDSWHTSTSKKDGGWSLEMRDVKNPCLEQGNWTSSIATRGGTPATANSVAETLNDLTAPVLLRTEAIDANTLRLTFNEKMDAQALQSATYQLSNGLAIQSRTIEVPTFTRLLLTLTATLELGTTYTLTINGLKDCNQNVLPNTQATFALPAPDATGDIVLNEILFNPRTGGVDFVELYNASNKFINLKDWKLANIQDGIIANQKSITTEVLTLAPKSYLLLTTDALLTQIQYPRSEMRSFYEIVEMPSYNDDEGTVILINAMNIARETFFYQDDFHFPLLDNEEGVSLERISPTLPTNTRNSWHSASERVGFATPGYLNSQSQTQAPQDHEIQINPVVFTPDGDGQDDFTNIQYKFGQAGKVMTAIVYDRQGRKIKTIAENQLLGTEEGTIVWDGTTQAQTLAPQGYYVVIVKVFDTQGNEKSFKKTVAIGIKF